MTPISNRSNHSKIILEADPNQIKKQYQKNLKKDHRIQEVILRTKTDPAVFIAVVIKSGKAETESNEDHIVLDLPDQNQIHIEVEVPVGKIQGKEIQSQTKFTLAVLR